jgi:hypothetical protein
MPDPNSKRDAALADIARELKDTNKVLQALNTNVVAIANTMISTEKQDRPPYTAKHLPFLDTLHDEMGLGAWWQRSEERQRVQNTAP